MTKSVHVWSFCFPRVSYWFGVYKISFSLFKQKVWSSFETLEKGCRMKSHACMHAQSPSRKRRKRKSKKRKREKKGEKEREKEDYSIDYLYWLFKKIIHRNFDIYALHYTFWLVSIPQKLCFRMLNNRFLIIKS